MIFLHPTVYVHRVGLAGHERLCNVGRIQPAGKYDRNRTGFYERRRRLPVIFNGAAGLDPVTAFIERVQQYRADKGAIFYYIRRVAFVDISGKNYFAARRELVTDLLYLFGGEITVKLNRADGTFGDDVDYFFNRVKMRYQYRRYQRRERRSKPSGGTWKYEIRRFVDLSHHKTDGVNSRFKHGVNIFTCLYSTNFNFHS